MDFWRYFFRGVPEGYHFRAFTPIHFLILALTGLGIWLIFKNRQQLSQGHYGTILRWILAVMLLLQQGILYLWYGFSGYFTIHEGLPLYNCRFAILCAALALLTRKKALQAISCYWGVFGSILALAVPSVDPFVFPHYTNFSFFGGHMLLIWASFFMLFIDRFEVSSRSLKFILFFTTTYHLLIYGFNRVTQSNYCYLMKAPIAEKFFAHIMPQVAYTGLIIFLWNLLMVGFYLSARSIYRILERAQEDSDLAF